MRTTDQVTIADRVISGFNQADWRQLAAIFSPNIRYVETGTNREVQGADPYLQLLQGWRHVFPDCTGTIQATVCEGTIVVHQVQWEGTQAAPLPTPGGDVPNKGRSMRVISSLWYVIDGGQVTELRHHLDVMTILQQLGAFEQEVYLMALPYAIVYLQRREDLGILRQPTSRTLDTPEPAKIVRKICLI